MNLYGKDVEIGNIKLSDYDLMIGFFDSNNSGEEDLGMSQETREEFIGNRSVPVYFGTKFTGKLGITMSLILNPCCKNYNNGEIPLDTCREILRNLTGRKYYQKMYIYEDFYDEPISYNVRCTSVSYHKIGERIMGIILELECDSQYAWAEPRANIISFEADKEDWIINNSDSLDEYVLPQIQIYSKEPIDELRIINVSDNCRETVIKNISAGEYIYMDSARCTLSSSIDDRNVLNDFNFMFIKLLSGANMYKTNKDVEILFKFKEPRKVGLR